MPMRPLIWLKLAPVALLPLFAAYAISASKTLHDLEQRASEALVRSQADWATLKMDGRDAIVRGDSPSQQAIDAAVVAVSRVAGIRKVESAARLLPPPAGTDEGGMQ